MNDRTGRLTVIVGAPRSPRARAAVDGAEIVTKDQVEAAAAFEGSRRVVLWGGGPYDGAVRRALGAGADVEVVPGPSPIIDALVLSGLDTQRVVVETVASVAELVTDARTAVLVLSSPADHRAVLARLPSTRAASFTTAGSDQSAPTSTWRGRLGDLPMGAGVLVVAGAQSDSADRAAAAMSDDQICDALLKCLKDGSSRRDAVSSVSAAAGVRRSRVYELALGLRAGPGAGARQIDA